MRFGQLAAAHGDRYRHSVIALDGVFDMAAHLSREIAVTCITPTFDKKAGLRNLPRFRRFLAEHKPDRLVTYNWGAIEWSLANRFFPFAPDIHIEDGFGPEESRRQLRRRVIARRIALSGRHTRVILPSRGLERMALDDWRLDRTSVIYLPNGVDCTRFAEAEATRAARANAPGTIVVGTVATLRQEKDIGRLIRAFAVVARERPGIPLKLMIVGDGPERNGLQALAETLDTDGRIIFAGHTRNPEHALAQMDLFALSSQTEQMPLSVLEAMASALPIAAVAVGDVASMVADDNARFITPVDDEARFRTSLRTLIDDPHLREQIGAANRAAALTRFDQVLMTARYAELFG